MENVLNITGSELVKALSIYNDLHGESDRSAVILGTANLDILLYQILQKYLIPCASSKDDLFEGDGPLSAFGVKIDLVYRLGLIDGECSRALHLSRKIRNEFAHEVSKGTLSTGAHRDRVKAILSRFEDFAPFKGIKASVIKAGEATPSDEFRIVLSILSVYLTIICNTVVPLTPLGVPLSVFKAGSGHEIKS